MASYFFMEFDPARRDPVRLVALTFDVLWALDEVRAELEEELDDLGSVPHFDPEQWLYLGDPDWTPVDVSDAGAAWCPPEVLREYARAMTRLRNHVPRSHRSAWDRVARLFSDLGAKGRGLYCSADA